MTFVESMFCHLKNAQRQATSHPSDDQPPKSKVKEGGFWKKFDWWLMCALAIPVILETLDYTVVATAQPRIAFSCPSLHLLPISMAATLDFNCLFYFSLSVVPSVRELST